ncbi:unnamed protein product [Euphydryas editha]|uniref:Uncharacterized protein n=1 Tax=Euphydryas editha TaxID=104508 RepID=A0AAU9UZP1_EUPED|nr:unnamed protein product [Euphydryas editha]
MQVLTQAPVPGKYLRQPGGKRAVTPSDPVTKIGTYSVQRRWACRWVQVLLPTNDQGPQSLSPDPSRQVRKCGLSSSSETQPETADQSRNVSPPSMTPKGIHVPLIAMTL